MASFLETFGLLDSIPFGLLRGTLFGNLRHRICIVNGGLPLIIQIACPFAALALPSVSFRLFLDATSTQGAQELKDGRTGKFEAHE